MGKPAARLADMHTCPMVTGTVPHVGGPISGPGVPTVLIGGMPAAVMGDMCVCVGPPDTIVLGSTGVMIGGKPAARMGDTCAHGGAIVIGLATVMVGELGGAFAAVVLPNDIKFAIAEFVAGMDKLDSTITPLGDSKVQELLLKSPTLAKNMAVLASKGWLIKYGVAGGGFFCDKENNEIVFDPNETNGVEMTQTLAHESGHAMYTKDPEVPPQGLTKEEYVRRNVQSDLKDEGEATLTNCEIRNEILANDGDDIDIAGARAREYQQEYEDYEVHGDRDKARDNIGNMFADGERPSTDTTKTYRQYYSKWYEDHYDKVMPAP